MAAMKAIEVSGILEGNQLRFDEPLPFARPQRARAIILLIEDDITEQEWLYVASQNSAFDFLKGFGEDIYTVDDGKPF